MGTSSVGYLPASRQRFVERDPQLGDRAEPLCGLFHEATLDDFVHTLGELRMPVVY